MLPALSILEFRSFCESFWLLSQNCMSQVFSCCSQVCMQVITFRCWVRRLMMSHQLRMSAATQRPPVSTVDKFCKVFFSMEYLSCVRSATMATPARAPRAPARASWASWASLRGLCKCVAVAVERSAPQVATATFFFGFLAGFLHFSYFFFVSKWRKKAERRHRRPRRRPLAGRFDEKKEKSSRDFQSRFGAVRSLQSRPGSLGPSETPEVSVQFHRNFTCGKCTDLTTSSDC